MPELPEVECVRIGLLDVIHQKILNIERSPSQFQASLMPAHSLDWDVLIGQRFLNIMRRGKSLRILTEDYQVLGHLGMSGVLLWGGDLRPHTHFKIYCEKGLLHYSDPRRFGYWEIQQHATPLPRWENLGLDVLDPLLQAADLRAKTQHKKASIKSILLDQNLLAGVGNIYACEVLFAARIHPERSAMSIQLQEWEDLLSKCREIMSLAIANRGTTFSDYRLTNGKGGEFQNFLKVFQKEDKPCPTCQKPIQRLNQNQRSTFFCSHCQK